MRKMNESFRGVVRLLVVSAVSFAGFALPQSASATISGTPMEMKREVKTGEMGLLDHNGRGLQCQLRAKALENRISNPGVPVQSPARNAGTGAAVRAG